MSATILDPAALEAEGRALATAGRLADATAALRESLALRPGHADTLLTLALVRRDLDDWEEAARLLADACVADPGHAYARYCLGTVLLALGRYEEGMPARLAGRHSVIPENAIPGEPWRGEAMQTSRGDPATLLLHADGGLGDTIMLARYVPLCAARCKVVMAGHPSLARLFATLPGLAEFAGAPPGPLYHRHLPMEHLPQLWGTTPDTVPGREPYLAADPAIAARFARRLAALPGRKIGLVWAGNASFASDHERSIPLAALAPILAVPGVSFVSLQLGPAADQAHDQPELHDWTADITDFADTAGLIDGLDLVISVDTAVLHLAGAMGKPVWLLNRLNTDWRWGLGRSDSAWYPSLRQFRQTTLGDWAPPIAAAATALAREVAGSSG